MSRKFKKINQPQKKKVYSSHHDRSPGWWMRGERIVNPKKRLYPSLAQLDKDWG